MKKKFIALNTSIMIGLGSLFSIPAVQAESISNIESKRTGIQEEIAEAQKLIKELNAEQAKLTKQIEQVEQAIKENNAKITKTKEQIKETQADVDALKKSIAALEERIANREEVLKERALSFQESGGDVNYVEVLFGATDFSDFVGRVQAVATMAQADRDILAQQEADKAELEEKKAAVEKKLSNLKSMKVELEGMQVQIESQKKQSEGAMAKLEAKEATTKQLQESLEKKDANLASQIASILEERRQEAKRKAAEEQTLQQAAREAQQSTQSSTSNNSSSTSSANSKSDTSDKSKSTESAEPKAAAPKPSSANTGSAITAGYKYIGNSTYKFGGGRTASDIANGLFDCSAFVSWAYRQAGVSLPAHTDALAASGTKISASQMQPGDLVFFDTYKRNGHVGIYVGGGKFIGSQSSTGVAIANMSSGYWADTFKGYVVRVN
ncbi:C40 family peptidase [Peribacillus asahii]|uniref:Peptidase n=1 Tax=Peribacillus asahii TaxID=228899 RepID=A0A3Q9RKX8_9BACI|nr:C40 family peptidase [Peribacillus asahii]AZV41987.1 peptidase [Peribacillus asahii]